MSSESPGSESPERGSSESGSSERGSPEHGPPSPAEFEAKARELFESIPSEYRVGIEGLQVRRVPLPHPSLAGVYTLGECRVVEWASLLDSVAEIRSEVVLYYGSFVRLAEADPDFDWEAELWETLTHEVQHHLEFRAEVSTLEERDYADDHNFRRAAGEPFDPAFYRSGEPAGEGVYRVGDDWFVEGRWVPGGVEFGWRGRSCRVPGPTDGSGIAYIRVHGLEAGPGDLWVVAMRGGWRAWWRWIRGGSRVVFHEAEAECVSHDG